MNATEYFMIELYKYKELTGREPTGAVLQNWFYIKIKEESQLQCEINKLFGLDIICGDGEQVIYFY